MNLLIVFAESIIELAPDKKSEETKQNTGIVINVYFSTSYTFNKSSNRIDYLVCREPDGSALKTGINVTSALFQ